MNGLLGGRGETMGGGGGLGENAERGRCRGVGTPRRPCSFIRLDSEAIFLRPP